MCFYSMNDLLDMCRDRRTGALLNGFKPALIMWMFHRIGQRNVKQRRKVHRKDTRSCELEEF